VKAGPRRFRSGQAVGIEHSGFIGALGSEKCGVPPRWRQPA